MGSKSPATTTQQQTQNISGTSNPWAPATPLLQNLLGGYWNVNPQTSPYQTNAGNAVVGAAGILPNELGNATRAVQNIFSNAGMIPAAYRTLQSNLAGVANPANVNPYATPGFSDALNTLNQNITNTVKGQYAASEREPAGAGTMPQTLARGLTQGEAPIIQSQYNQNMGNLINANQILQNAGINTSTAMGGNMLQALQGAGMLPSLGMAPAEAQFQAANQQWGQPIANLNQILSPATMLGGMGGQTTGTGTLYGTGTQAPANDPMSNILGGITGTAGAIGSLFGGGGTAALPAMMSFLSSDRRMKTDIKDIGRTHDNQKIYSYRFKGSNVPQVGMMADEIEKKTPDAVATGPGGMKFVRYDRATRKAAEMGMLSKRAA